MQITQDGNFAFPNDSVCPDPWVLAKLPLGEGRNQLEYVLEGNNGSSVSADIWLWDATDQLVVFDIDGTITKSDVRGLVANQLQEATSFLSNALTSLSSEDNAVSAALDTDYIHDGVVEAALQIALSGYRILYLTARPITMADKTRHFLASLGRQQQDLRMPPGPLITQPVNTMKALAAKHDEFKAGVLGRLSSAMLPGCFAAGFGNTDTDVAAYSGAGVPHSHIFVLDKASRLRVHESGEEMQSYSALLSALPALFPRVRSRAPAHPRPYASEQGPHTLSAHSAQAGAPRAALPPPSKRPSASPPGLPTQLRSPPEGDMPASTPQHAHASQGAPGRVPAPRSWDGRGVAPPPRREAEAARPASLEAEPERWSARSLMESFLPGCASERAPPSARARARARARAAYKELRTPRGFPARVPPPGTPLRPRLSSRGARGAQASSCSPWAGRATPQEALRARRLSTTRQRRSGACSWHGPAPRSLARISLLPDPAVLRRPYRTWSFMVRTAAQLRTLCPGPRGRRARRRGGARPRRRRAGCPGAPRGKRTTVAGWAARGARAPRGRRSRRRSCRPSSGGGRWAWTASRPLLARAGGWAWRPWPGTRSTTGAPGGGGVRRAQIGAAVTATVVPAPVGAAGGWQGHAR